MPARCQSGSPPADVNHVDLRARPRRPPRRALLAVSLISVVTWWGCLWPLAAGRGSNSSSAGGRSSSAGGKDSLVASHCARYSAFEAGIAEDLLPWYDQGIR